MSWKLGTSKSKFIPAGPPLLISHQHHRSLFSMSSHVLTTNHTESKDTKENGVVSRSVTPIPSRPTTPKPPGALDQQAHLRSGMLAIRIFSGKDTPRPVLHHSVSHTNIICAGRGLSLAPGVRIPEVIQKALDNPPARKTSNRESMQRRRLWWLPYVVLEFDNNQVLIDAMGGDLANPVWSYRADLCVICVR
jgi:serum/glucocorticoid-regulated kinase 2